jgi:hypothetical protein
MLGVEKAETLSPDVAINSGLRLMKNKRMTPELINVLKKMLNLAGTVGINVDKTLIPKALQEETETNHRITVHYKKSWSNEPLKKSYRMDHSTPDKEVEDNHTKLFGGEIIKIERHKIDEAITKFKDFVKTDKQGPLSDKEAADLITPPQKTKIPDDEHTETGNSLDVKDDDSLRKMKSKYMTESFVVRDPSGKVVHVAYTENLAKRKSEELSKNTNTKHTVHFVRAAAVEEDMQSADFKINPQTGRKYRARHINFAASKMGASPVGDQEDEDEQKGPITIKTKPLMKRVSEETEKEDGFSEKDLEDMADTVDEPEDVEDVYDGEEFEVVDAETGEVHNDEFDKGVNEELINEVMSRMARMKARAHFMQSKSKRSRRLQIALRTRSNTQTLNKRAHSLAIKMLKQRIMKKPLAKMSISEKERAEKFIQQKKSLVNRLALKLISRIRKVETNRLSHKKFTK